MGATRYGVSGKCADCGRYSRVADRGHFGFSICWVCAMKLLMMLWTVKERLDRG